MKSIRILLLLCLFAIFNASCSKSGTQPQNTSSGTSNVPDNISLAFNGSALNSSMPQAIYSQTAGMLQIGGTFSSSASLTININKAAVGSFSIQNGEANAVFSLDNSPSDAFIATSGTVNISSFNANGVSGTFQFSVTTSNNITSEITNGQFLIHNVTQ